MDDVLIVGAGPAGLVTAAELALAGVRCRILERRAERSGRSRAFGLHARTLELLDARGLAEPLVERGYRSPEIRPDTRLVDLHQLSIRLSPPLRNASAPSRWQSCWSRGAARRRRRSSLAFDRRLPPGPCRGGGGAPGGGGGGARPAP
ncbi:FAD-dependent oxidoreductase, partial [Streptomyces sp. NPDC048415]|uniref:FAD-dependent oxidoreductase n=1 Tax=Streptomyces sp. NPDC048415 TaxID=3154822 RepID=UPI00343A8CE1